MRARKVLLEHRAATALRPGNDRNDVAKRRVVKEITLRVRTEAAVDNNALVSSSLEVDVAEELVLITMVLNFSVFSTHQLAFAHRTVLDSSFILRPCLVRVVIQARGSAVASAWSTAAETLQRLCVARVRGPDSRNCV